MRYRSWARGTFFINFRRLPKLQIFIDHNGFLFHKIGTDMKNWNPKTNWKSAENYKSYEHFSRRYRCIVLTRPAVEYGMWRHSEGACPPAQNFPRLIQAREIIFDAATFALLVYLTYRIDFLLKFQVSFNPDRPFNIKLMVQ